MRLFICFLLCACSWLAHAQPNVGTVREVRTFADLVALPINSTGPAQTVIVRDRTTRGDGGGGTFYQTNTVTGTNTGTRIASAASGWSWQRLNLDPLIPQFFGAKGDGTTDDTAAIKAALVVANRSALYVGTNTYLLTEGLNLTNLAGLRLYGNRSAFSYLANEVPGGAKLLFSGVASNCLWITGSGITVENLVVSAAGASNGIYVAASLNYATPNLLRGLRVTGASSAGVTLGELVNSLHMEELALIANTNGLRSIGTNTTTWSLSKSTIGQNVLDGLYIACGENVSIRDCVIESNGRNGEWIHWPDDSRRTRAISHDNVWYEANGNSAVLSTATTYTNWPSWNSWKNCNFAQYTTLTNGVLLTDSLGASFENCLMFVPPTLGTNALKTSFINTRYAARSGSIVDPGEMAPLGATEFEWRSSYGSPTFYTKVSTNDVSTALWLQGFPDTAWDKGMALELGYKAPGLSYTSRIVHYGSADATVASRMRFQTHETATTNWNTGLLLDELDVLTPGSHVSLRGNKKLVFEEDSTNYYLGGVIGETYGLIGHSYYGFNFQGNSGTGLRVSSTGNVGVQKLVPTVALDVTGTIGYDASIPTERDYLTLANGGTLVLVATTNIVAVVIEGATANFTLPPTPASGAPAWHVRVTNVVNNVITLSSSVWDLRQFSTLTITNLAGTAGLLSFPRSTAHGVWDFVQGTVAGGAGSDSQTAEEVPFTPTGTIAATDVQAAIAEVASEAALASTAVTESSAAGAANYLLTSAGADRTAQAGAATIVIPVDTAVTLSGGVNGINFGTNTLSIDAANGRVGIGTAAPTQRLEVGDGGAGANNETVAINAGATGQALTTYKQNGTLRGLFGLSGGTDGLITGSALGDFAFRNSQKILFSANSGDAAHMVIATTGGISIGNTVDPGSTNLSVTGSVLANNLVGTNGVASKATDTAVSIATTGWTNTFGKNAVVMLEGVGVTYTIYNNAGTAVYTNVATVVNASIPLQVSGKVIVTAGTGVSGTAFPW